MQMTLEEQALIVTYWEKQRGPVEPITVSACVPSAAVVMHQPDETPVHILSYRFNDSKNTQMISLLENYKQAPENEFLNKAFGCSYTEAVGNFLADNNIFDPNSPSFENDVAMVSKHSAMTSRPSRKGEKIVSGIGEFTVNAGTLRVESSETWSRFLETKKNFQHYMYFKKCELHRDINIPE